MLALVLKGVKIMESFHDIVSPKDVADFLLFESRELGEALTNLKLQKLLYYAQAWYLALQDKPLFSEDFQAWVHGAVLPSQYQRFKKFEWRPILEKIAPPQLSDGISSHLTEVVNVFGIETAAALELMNHKERPWLEARKGIEADQPSDNVISKESMKSFYKSLE
jgi:uncharacterized phage-associated protein